MHSLRQHPDFYGDGLALGNGEITLLELVGAYATLARNGVYRPLRIFRSTSTEAVSRRVFSPEASSLIADIISELRKVVWPTRAETANLTLVVIVVAVAVGILLGVVDWGFSRILENVLLP